MNNEELLLCELRRSVRQVGHLEVERRNFGSDQTLGGGGVMTNSESDLTAYALGSGLGRPRYLSEKAEATGGQDSRLTVISSESKDP